MFVGNLTDPVLVRRQNALKDLSDTLAESPIIAVDTESNSLHAYREQVCLIQFSTLENDYLVDPLAIRDLSPLDPIFADPNIEKVFHAAEYDLLCLKRDFNFTFSNLFDTMVAARILGREAFGLGSILEEEFGVHLDKRFQRANWGQRPLPADLLTYARFDTHFLIQLRDRLKADLVARNLMALAQEDFDRMTNVNGKLSEERSPDFWRISGAYDLKPQQAAVLAELVRYRDRMARTLNRPLFKVLNDSTLLAIAAQAPQDLDSLGRLPGMSRGQVDRHGKALLDAVENGLQADPVYPPRLPRPNEQFLERLDALRRWRKEKAAGLGVKSDVVLPRDLLYTLAEKNPRNPESLGELLDDVPWRREHFGEEILDVLMQTRN